MDLFKKEFICILKSAFSNEKHAVSQEFDWDKAVKLAIKHNIAATLYYGALSCGISDNTVHMQKLFALTCKSLMISEKQLYELQKVFAEFEKEGIEYMPLKGMVLKSVYPKTEMRTMGDADVLIKPEQYSKAEAVMNRLGFVFQRETDHEFIWVSRSLLLELHKSIVSTYNKDLYNYFGSGWKLANRISGSNRYEMSPEDFYIYIFVHLTKHYRISGIGIKHILDLWVFSNANPGLNRDYIFGELEKMNLHKFYINLSDTIDTWFNHGAPTDITDFITDVIFNSGQYGDVDMAVVNRAVRDKKGAGSKNKAAMIFGRIFLPYKDMKMRYSILKKVPILLPVMWIVRWFEILFLRKHVIKKYMTEMKLINSQSVNEHIKALDYVGLNLNFDENKNKLN